MNTIDHSTCSTLRENLVWDAWVPCMLLGTTAWEHMSALVGLAWAATARAPLLPANLKLQLPF